MNNYIIAYYVGKQPRVPEDGAQCIERFQAWLDGLGDAVVNPGTPLGLPRRITLDGISDESGSNRLTGFSIVQADSIDIVIDMAKACPHLEIGTVEVSEVIET